ncbi:ABC transporter ATP-binding protein [Oscillochloris sp. ZM17-4]|uniref:ABC transporter ATP-binding protein n=1 Tax=Oscillochloris sp. ZM17-4 TaxID=2866714 RepID=UPI001C73461E|nr:ABC transporter ATP-binding protein [Oscillochloris sp. ZM17-4]MBX0326656.1 ABC transporter ATP-binding protein [Oscillochloris sp. ZM17-4]
MIEVSDLTYTYPKAHGPALRGLGFRIERGEIFGFLGPSGAGKSTTQKILIGLLRGYAGRACVMGREVGAWGSDYYERVGVAFELPNHFMKLTARENLRYFAALYRGQTRRPADLLAQVGLEGDADTPVAQFSKGMRVRLNLARALIHSPDLLFLDEPTSGLDPVNSQRVKELIRAEQAAGRTIFLTTHNMAIADDLCDRVAFIAEGKIAAIDAPRALKLRYGAPTVRVEYAGEQGAEQRDFPLEGLGACAAFTELLRTHAVQTIHSQEASLEQIFIRVTGRSLQWDA